ncbi:MAG TPA: cytochrome c [Gammaproteobacteria bacterium]|nr:cytochrome c [Gammaproteobacteria bacterium]
MPTLKTACAAVLLCAALPALADGNPAAGREKAETVCAACHGAGGAKPLLPEYPILAGQYADYLEQTLKDYRSGVRNNPIMKGQAAALTDQEIRDLAAYFARQPSPLGTVK